MRFFFVGQQSMANRGCEALIRSNTKLIREKHPDARLLCPSDDQRLDLKQWPDAKADGIDFVALPHFPTALKVWGRIFKVIPAVRRLGVLPLHFDAVTQRYLHEADAILMTGGDIVSLEYGLNSLYYWTGIVDAAHRMGKPTHLLAASVGPFTKDPVTERQMTSHLKRYNTITVRETASLDYLEQLGVKNVRLVADPAFVLEPAPLDVSLLFDNDRDTIGLNVSPLVRKFRPDEDSRRDFDDGVKAFIRSIVAGSDDNILLIPHVDPLKGTWDNSDRAYMGRLLSDLSDLGPRVRMTPDLLNAEQIKYVLGACRYFIGARTHATIGAISQSVPTLSIAYSIKALGINKDLFGSTRYVLPTPEVSEATLHAGLALLRADELAIKATLAEKLPIWKARARDGIVAL
jgi:polysaccharide pyruvyl transferase WcaK-like protein